MEDQLTLDSILDKHPALRCVEHRKNAMYREVKSYVLRGQQLKESQLHALDELYDDYVIEYKQDKLDFAEVFGNSNPVVIEIGFGMGDSTAKIAAENPDINYLGIEVFLYGFSKLLSNIRNYNLKNLKIMRFDAVQVISDMVNDFSVDGFHIFFPDPWPKKRHRNRRIIQVPFAQLLASKLKKNGYIYCVTDWEEYAQSMLEIFSQIPLLTNPYGGLSPASGWRPETNFERKGLDKNYKISEIRVIREPDAEVSPK